MFRLTHSPEILAESMLRVVSITTLPGQLYRAYGWPTTEIIVDATNDLQNPQQDPILWVFPKAEFWVPSRDPTRTEGRTFGSALITGNRYFGVISLREEVVLPEGDEATLDQAYEYTAFECIEVPHRLLPDCECRLPFEDHRWNHYKTR